MKKPVNLLNRAAPILGAVALLAVCQVAGAQTAINLDTSLAPATTAICNTIKGIQTSAFLAIIAVVMFVAGLGMMWLKVRGGMGLAIGGFVGYFLVKQSLNIAKTVGILPASCVP